MKVNKSTLWVMKRGKAGTVKEIEGQMKAGTIKQIESCGWLPITETMTESDKVVSNNLNKESTLRLSNILSGMTKKNVLVQFRNAGKNNGVIVYGPGAVEGAPTQFVVWFNPSLDIEGLVKGAAIATARILNGGYKKPTEKNDKVGKVKYTFNNGMGGTGKVAFDGAWVVSQGITKIEATNKDGVVTKLTVDEESLNEALMFAEVINARLEESAANAEAENIKLKERIAKMEAARIEQEKRDAKNAEKMAEMKARVKAYEAANAA